MYSRGRLALDSDSLVGTQLPHYQLGALDTFLTLSEPHCPHLRSGISVFLAELMYNEGKNGKAAFSRTWHLRGSSCIPSTTPAIIFPPSLHGNASLVTATWRVLPNPAESLSQGTRVGLTGDKGPSTRAASLTEGRVCCFELGQAALNATETPVIGPFHILQYKR